MLAEVRRCIRRENMLGPGEPLWVAVSGGVDSMVLLRVMHALGHPCHVAHVDHGLRGAQSDRDRLFVEEAARTLGVPFRSVRVDPKAAGEGLSVQMAARGLRYAWFKELLHEGPGVIALGHHSDDTAETLLLYLLRGIGPKGWSGIPPVTQLPEGRIVRPLLTTGRAAIHEHALRNGISFREDASNADPKYLRNRVRHELLPLMEDLRPGARITLARAAGLLRELHQAARLGTEQELQGAMTDPNDCTCIPLSLIRHSVAPRLLLQRLLEPVHLHPGLVDQLLEAVDQGATGTGFQVGSYQLMVERDNLSVQQGRVGFPMYPVDLSPPFSGAAGPFRWSLCEPGQVNLGQGLGTAWLDLAKLEAPLVLRPWRHGDRMRPIGLKGSKLISDMLIDAHVPARRKAGSYVLTSGDQVAWLVGHRVAEGFAPGPGTRQVLRLDHTTR